MPGFANARANKNRSTNNSNLHTSSKASPSKDQRVVNDVSRASAPDILNLQRSLGNQAVCSLVQAKLRVGDAGDRYEQEADNVADAVINKKADTEIKLQRSGNMSGEFEVDNNFQRDLSLSSNGGSALPATLRREFEPRFGARFNDVRVHTDARADQLNNSIQANAFTYGNNIYFARGQYSPGTNSGKHLIAHELTHTIQQSGGIQRETKKKKESGKYSKKINKLEDIFRSKSIFNDFRRFCEKEWSTENLDCYLDILDYEKRPSKEKARSIYDKFVDEDAPYVVNVSASDRKNAKDAIESITDEQWAENEQSLKKANSFMGMITGRRYRPDASLSNVFSGVKASLKANLSDTISRFRMAKKEEFKELKKAEEEKKRGK